MAIGTRIQHKAYPNISISLLYIVEMNYIPNQIKNIKDKR